MDAKNWIENNLGISFEEWFEENLGEYAGDISRHGAVMGFPKITYYSDTSAIYDIFKKDIWDLIGEIAEQMDVTPLELLASCGELQDTVYSDTQFKNVLVWIACEELARKQSNE